MIRRILRWIYDALAENAQAISKFYHEVLLHNEIFTD